jgi:predicted NodU family carbamoyl transferase
MDALAITTGHNSSAVAIRDGEILGGYEEERFTGKKSDSSFPINSIAELKGSFNLSPKTNIFVSHWFPDGILVPNTKYWNMRQIKTFFPHYELMTLGPALSHHDAHMYSVIPLLNEFPDNYHILVADGFGTFGEHISIYQKTSETKEPKLLRRWNGFNGSLGMMYQYATAYCKMKMHEDEYKMLGYETHILELVTRKRLEEIDAYIGERIEYWIWNMNDSSEQQESLSTLPSVQSSIDKMLTDYLLRFNCILQQDYNVKVMVAYFIQSLLEGVMRWIIHEFQPINLAVVGGVFYNVKLNDMLCNMISGKFCAMPLAGDQGAGLGVYHNYCGNLKWPDHLFWGKRYLDLSQLYSEPGIVVTKNPDQTLRAIETVIKDLGIVNLVRGQMEYGPRALCNTSTLAMPTLANVEKINSINNRTTVMPFGLVCTEQQANEMFEDIYVVHKSLEYMIMTREFRTREIAQSVPGGAHEYPIFGYYTCRPQVVYGTPFLNNLLVKTGPLINTSFNYHGVPIVRSTPEILYTHRAQRSRIITVVEEEQ